MQDRIKITAVVPGPGDATSLYRACGPFSQLRKTMPLDVDYPTGFMWTIARSSDIVFLQRPCSQDHLTIAKITKNCNVPLWIDIDDDLLNVPMENPVWEAYREPAMQELITTCLKMADIVTVASEELRQRYLQYNPNIVVILNGFDESWLKGYDPIQKKMESNVVVWRGTPSHIKDIASVADDIRAVAEIHPDLTWRFIGYFPWFLAEQMQGKNVQHIKAMDPFEYFQFLKGQVGAIGIVPLVDNPLNQCKSNIAWQEFTLSGAVVLGPDLPQWQYPGIHTYNKTKTFKDQLLGLLENPDQHKESLSKSLKVCRNELSLTKLNEKRRDIILQLIGKIS